MVNGGNEVLALVPKTAARGNRTAKLTEEQEHWLTRIIEEWALREARNYKACYLELCDLRQRGRQATVVSDSD